MVLYVLLTTFVTIYVTVLGVGILGELYPIDQGSIDLSGL